MENQDKALAGIILRSVFTTLTQEEQEQLSRYLDASEANRQKYRELTDAAVLEGKLRQYEQVQAGQEASWRQVLQRIHAPAARVRTMPPLRRWGWAAAVLLFMAAGAWFWAQRQPAPAPLAQHSHLDVAPGKTGALLTLADGSQLVLDSLHNGVIATQNGAQVSLQNGQVAYHASGLSKAADTYNTMTTPKGRQFNLVLPDGSKVWLNAASSLTYPTAFNGSQRRVSVSGEAYFEVAKNERQPFIVEVNHRSTVEVLGTKFNVNAYTNERDVKTTLLEGSVRTGGLVLRPGQQAAQQPGQPVVLLDKVNIAKIMAWKNGLFDFNDASLQEVMRQLERWYDIEVVYEKGVPETYFYGKVRKDIPLSGILKLLEVTHVHFRIEAGRRLVVMP